MSSLLPFISCQLNPFLKPTLCAIPISHPHAYILHEPSKTSSNHFYILSIKKPGFCCFTPSSFPIQVKLAEERKEREVVDSTKLVALKQNLEKHGIHCGDTSTLKRGEYNRLMCPKLVSLNNLVGVCDSYPSRWRESFRPWKRDNLQKLCARTNYASIVAACALSSELDLRVSTDSVEGVSIASTTSSESGEIKISVNVAGAKSQAIFDNVFSKMVAAAQPIPGFRREKGDRMELLDSRGYVGKLVYANPISPGGNKEAFFLASIFSSHFIEILLTLSTIPLDMSNILLKHARDDKFLRIESLVLGGSLGVVKSNENKRSFIDSR
ncbi:hypothetical protein GIB67_028482 [Kingdonia uniflora]|uniref:Uncharacterized protein n=1 Tax=Kingdonia uniflora TaxID=39325 RepID=A0A7J7P1W8_9MAGN|nr:hypothetical protein GIB67_028482 [Kingdonia uniflora]